MRILLLLSLSLCCTASMTAQISDYVTGLSSPVGLAQSGNTLFVCDIGSSKIQKIDMTATNPVAVDFVNNIFAPTKMVIIGNDMYITSLEGDVSKVDITLTNPSIVTVVSGLALPFGLAVKDNFIYVSLRNSGNGGIIRFDHTQTNPIVETLITGLSEPVYDIAIYGNNLYMTIQSVGMIFKIDITQTNPVLEDVIAAPGVNDVVVEGDFLYYCSNYISRINLLDATPVAESIISGITSAWDLLFDGDDLFIARQVMREIEKLNSAFVDPTLSPDYDALVGFYNSTDGLNWTNSTNWIDPAKSLYSWHGVVSNENNKIVGINLAGNNLSGTLSTEIGDFDQLKILSISGNMLTGDLPSSLYDLTNLETLWLAGNNFTGTISPSIANLSNLSYLYIQNNEFTGTIPSEFGGLTPLTVLHLYDNNFEGILPSSLSNLTNLTSIAISDNNFEGTIPFNAPNANINVTNNYFDFSDLEPFILANNFNSLQYSPQRTPD
jgi:DNA-binding beta-propeller fold protein YncE